MAYDDKDLGPVFPTRTGPPQGKTTERGMLDVVGGAAGIRTRVAENLDGSKTLLRTRAGNPEFITTGGVSPTDPCVRGPFEEVDFSQRRWHTALADLVSSDGIFRIPRAPLRKIAVEAGETDPKRLVELHLAASALGGQLTSPTPGALALIEPAYGNRLWHAKQMGRIVENGLYFCMNRLRALVLTCPKLTGQKLFTWWFSKEADPAMSGGLPICLNRDAQETGLTTRILHGLSALKQFSLRVKTRAGTFITAAPGGFLGGFESPTEGGPPEFPAVLNDNDQVLNDLSRALSCGQPWHGWMDTSGILTTADLVNFPAGLLVSPSGYVAPDTGDTHYFAIPGLPDVSDAVPDDFAYNGMRYFKDAIFFGSTKRYSPIAEDFNLGSDRWLHYGATTGEIHVLRLEIVGPVTKYGATVRIHNDGKLTLWGVEGTSAQIGEFFLAGAPSSIDARIASTATVLYYASTDFFAASYPGVPNYTKPFRMPFATSPAGGAVAVLLYYFPSSWKSLSNTAGPHVLSAWEITVPDNLSLLAAAEKYSLGVPVPTEFATYLTIHYVRAFSHTRDAGGGVLYDVYSVWERMEKHGDDVGGEWDRGLIGANFLSGGTLALTNIIYSIAFGAAVSLTDEATAYTYEVPHGDPDPTGAELPDLPRRQAWREYTEVVTLEAPDYDLASVLYTPTTSGHTVDPDEFDTYYDRANWWHPAANNLTLLAPKNLHDSAVFVGPDVVVEGTTLGYYYTTHPDYPWLFGYASYNPRTSEIRWSSTPIGCV
jgi:hypothetical protein